MDYITMAHGAGGKASHELMEKIILPELGNDMLNELHDGAVFSSSLNGRMAFTTDSYVVRPRFFNGGNIGKLAVCGTVNDLAMTGAVPKYLSLALVIEEGFSVKELKEILHTISITAKEANVKIVTGDTKVVEKGAADGIFINTAGVGEIIEGTNISPRNIKPHMKVIVSGFIGDHAATILGARHGLSLPEGIKSDCAPLCHLTKAMLEVCPDIAVLRDPTRGGLAATLNELAEKSNVGIILDEEKIPIRPEVEGVCDILGFDPLYLANEGKLIAIAPAEASEKIIGVMRKTKYGENACIIGETTSDGARQVGVATALGGIRLVDMPMGNLVPRIC